MLESARHFVSVQLTRPLAGLLAGLTLCVLEFAYLGHLTLGIFWVAATLFAAHGLALGWICEAIERLVARYHLTTWKAAAARGAATILITAPAAGPSFEGAFASTLPGARWAFLWVPLLAAAATTVVLRGYELLCQRHGEQVRQRIDTALVAIFSLTAALLEIANRRIKFTEYPEAHTLVISLTLLGLYLALRLSITHVPMPVSWPKLPLSQKHRRATLAAAAALYFIAFLQLGLGDAQDRVFLSNHSMHTRMLVRATRSILDLDGDHYGSVLHGADCDEFSAMRYPGAAEIPGNDIDEDCDGIAATMPMIDGSQKESLAQAVVSWNSNPRRVAFVENLRAKPIILIVVDALRADMLQDTPTNRRDFPNFFEILDHSNRFDRAFSPSAGTDLSMATVFTGSIEAFHSTKPTLFEHMRASGRRLHAVIPREVLRYAGQPLLTRGLASFDRVVNDPAQRDVGGLATASKTTRLGLTAIDRMRGEAHPFGVWLHYFDTHEHDQLPTEVLPLNAVSNPSSAAEKRYRAATHLVDIGIGELIAGLKKRGLWKDTIIVMWSDHGESLGEEARLPQNHGRLVYNTLVHVPLAIKLPGTEAQHHADAVSLLDLYSTILELTSSDAHASSDGISLVPWFVPGAPPVLKDRRFPIALNESDQRGMIAWPYKLLRRPADNYMELFDISRDFAERENLLQSPLGAAKLQELAGKMSTLPTFEIDRTRKGRMERDLLAKRHAVSDEAIEQGSR